MSSPVIWKGLNALLLNSGGIEYKDGTTILSGSGNPNGIVSATKGSIYYDKAGSATYQNSDGTTAWTKLSRVEIPFTIGDWELVGGMRELTLVHGLWNSGKLLVQVWEGSDNVTVDSVEFPTPDSIKLRVLGEPNCSFSGLCVITV